MFAFVGKPFRAIEQRLRDAKLLGKLLVPFLLVVAFMGITGTFFTVRFLTARAQDQVDRDAFLRSVDVDVYFRDQALGLLESIRFASNIQGVPEAVEARDKAQLRRLLASVVAVRSDLDHLIATDARGLGLVEIERQGSGIAVSSGRRWGSDPAVSQVLRRVTNANGDKHSGLLDQNGVQLFATAGPIKSKSVVGVMIAGAPLQGVVAGAAERNHAGVSLFDDSGRLLASSPGGSHRAPPAIASERSVRQNETIGKARMATLYTPFEIQGERAGTLAVSVPTAAAFKAVGSARFTLLVVLLLAMAAIVGIGSLINRMVLRQVRPLVETNRALGRGEFTARAEVLGKDELGEVAQGLNNMAEELQASYQELEMRVEQRTEELQRALQSRAEFFASISHEFRTPLFAIITHADLMLDPDFKPRDSSWKREFAETIKGAGEDLLANVNEILDLAKLESGRAEVELQEVDLGKALESVRSTMVALARRGELTATLEVPPGLPIVKADPTRLRQILLNLISNGVKYTPAGGKVRVFTTMKNDTIEVSVADSGVGIPGDVGEKIFEPFYQVKGTKAQKGQASTGLGLALVKRLVEAQGGTIGFVSAQGQGTTFTFSLHVAAPGSAKKRPRREAARGRQR